VLSEFLFPWLVRQLKLVVVVSAILLRSKIEQQEETMVDTAEMPLQSMVKYYFLLWWRVMAPILAAALVVGLAFIATLNHTMIHSGAALIYHGFNAIPIAAFAISIRMLPTQCDTAAFTAQFSPQNLRSLQRLTLILYSVITILKMVLSSSTEGSESANIWVAVNSIACALLIWNVLVAYDRRAAIRYRLGQLIAGRRF